MSVHSHISETTCSNKLHQTVDVCCWWSWFGPCLTSMQYVMYFRLCDNVIFANAPCSNAPCSLALIRPKPNIVRVTIALPSFSHPFRFSSLFLLLIPSLPSSPRNGPLISSYGIGSAVAHCGVTVLINRDCKPPNPKFYQKF